MDSDLCDLGRAKRSYFKAAEGVSSLSDHRCQIGCVVVKNHRIISSGHNSRDITHAFQARIDKRYFGVECKGVLHAETCALLPLIRNRVNLSNATIYVYRQTRDGKISMSRPCPRCMSVIKQCGIKSVNYTTPDGYASESIKY